MTQEADLKVGGLSIWAVSRQFPDDQDYWDGNWLCVRAVLEAPGCYVETSGSFVRNDEIAAFAEQLVRLEAELKGTASLQCMEPTLQVSVQCRSPGHVGVTISLTPDHMTQSHEVSFEIDQTYLKAVLRGCRGLLERFPVRGSP